jgi:hypothetical protein
MSVCPARFEPRFWVLVCCSWRTNQGEKLGGRTGIACARIRFRMRSIGWPVSCSMCVVASPISRYASRRKASVTGGGGGEAFGDGARPIAPRDAVASQPAPGRTVSPPVGCDVVFPLRPGLGRLHADLHRLPRPSTESVRSVKTTQRPLDDIEHRGRRGSTPTDR